MRVLMIGDIVGRPGRSALSIGLPHLVERLRADFVVANGENAAGGAGITPKTFAEIRAAGVDVVTTGNHVFRRRQILPVLHELSDRLLRPANFSDRAPGRGFTIVESEEGRRVGVLNLQGRVFMPPAEDPFAAADRVLAEIGDRADLILVDHHAEATSEKQAMGYHLDGRVAAVVGTHTHVATADACILPGGTAYVTDLGMTGPHDSCLGVRKSIILKKFLTGLPERFDVASGDVRVQGVLIEIREASGKAVSVARVDERVEEADG